MDKDTRKVLDEAERQGFLVRYTSKGHGLVSKADKTPVTTFSGSASDVRSFRNALTKLKAAGFRWPPPRKR